MGKSPVWTMAGAFMMMCTVLPVQAAIVSENFNEASFETGAYDWQNKQGWTINNRMGRVEYIYSAANGWQWFEKSFDPSLITDGWTLEFDYEWQWGTTSSALRFRAEVVASGDLASAANGYALLVRQGGDNSFELQRLSSDGSAITLATGNGYSDSGCQFGPPVWKTVTLTWDATTRTLTAYKKVNGVYVKVLSYVDNTCNDFGKIRFNEIYTTGENNWITNVKFSNISGTDNDIFIDGLNIESTGWMTGADNLKMGVDFYDSSWVPAYQRTGALQLDSDTSSYTMYQWSINGIFSGFDFSELISKMDTSEFRYHVSVASASGIQTNQLCFSIMLPVRYFKGRSLQYGNQTIVLPETLGNEYIYSSSITQMLRIPTSDGTLVIRGANGIGIQDARKYGAVNDCYMIRLPFSPASGLITISSIDLEIELELYQIETINISSQVNRGFEDSRAGDGEGGWTDQGTDKDLSMFVPGRKRYAGVLFDVIDPADNEGVSCLGLCGTTSTAFIPSASILVGKKTFENLYLLHAIAFPPTEGEEIGHIDVKYSDGDSETIAVKYGQDVNNWCNPISVSNGDVVWTGTNTSNYAGLYLSRFAVASKPITSIKLEGVGSTVWMIIGISGGEDVPLPIVRPSLYTVDDEEWTEYTYDLTVQSGSPMDFSFLNDKPAGKFGHVIINNGHFAFENDPDNSVRFIGVNLCYTANFLDKASCRQLAINLARMGYNSVRFHHIDSALADWADQSVPLNSANLDKLDYLFACCKSQGIYVTMDLFSCRSIPDTVLPELADSSERSQEFKPLITLNEIAMTNWENYARNFLTHVNPYTGLAWKDDPALWGICVVNEDNLDYWWNHWTNIYELFQDAYTTWCNNENVEPGDVEFHRFLAECQLQTYQHCRDFIHSLGCETLLTDVNMGDSYLTRMVRPYLDYVDNHSYASSPVCIEQYDTLPVRISQNSDIEVGASMAAGCFDMRVFGKPFVVSEFNMAFPNCYRAQSGLVMGVYGALQDWDGLYRFAYSHTQWGTLNVGASSWMELSQDPINLLSERIAVLLFRRGDVSPARNAVPWLKSEAEILNPTIEDGEAFNTCRRLGLRYQTGQWIGSSEQSFGLDSLLCVLTNQESDLPGDIPRQAFNSSTILSLAGENDTIVSDTSQIRINPNENWMSVVTDKTECFAMAENQTLTGDIVSVENQGKPCVVAVSAIDNQPLHASQHLLVFHLTDSSNTLMKYFDITKTIIEDWGILPQLVRCDSALIRLKLPPDHKISAWAITMSGEQVSEIPISYQNGAYELTVNTDQLSGVCMTYELFIESRHVGDANGDGAVDVGDLGILAANYGTTSGATWSMGDFNGDGAIDVGDLGILAANYGVGSASGSSFDADYAKVFGTTATEEIKGANVSCEEMVDNLCSSLGLSLIAGLVLVGLMIVKSNE